jgi:hypothetical protein
MGWLKLWWAKLIGNRRDSLWEEMESFHLKQLDNMKNKWVKKLAEFQASKGNAAPIQAELKLMLEPKELGLVDLWKDHQAKQWAAFIEKRKFMIRCGDRDCAMARMAERN